MKNHSQLAGLILIITALFGFGYALWDYQSFQALPPPEKLERLWKNDIRKLKKAQKLHPGWKNIAEIESFAGTDPAKKWLKEIQIPIATQVNGDHKLEVLLLSWEDEGKIGAVIQYNLVDKKSGNMVWELGRTFILNEKPDPLGWLFAEPAVSENAEITPVSKETHPKKSQ